MEQNNQVNEIYKLLIDQTKVHGELSKSIGELVVEVRGMKENLAKQNGRVTSSEKKIEDLVEFKRSVKSKVAMVSSAVAIVITFAVQVAANIVSSLHSSVR